MKAWLDHGDVRVYHGDALDTLRTLPAGSVDCCVTSPPYYRLRDYGVPGQIGLEESPAEWVAVLVAVFAEVHRVLAAHGTLWLNLGDSHAGSWGAQGRGGPPSRASTLRGNGHVGGGPKIRSLSAAQIAHAPRRESRTGSIPPGSRLKPKDLIGAPWMVAFALREAGWWLRSDVIWSKPNPMPESARDRPTSSHEHVFLLAKASRYYYDAEAISEPDSGRDAGNGFVRPVPLGGLTDGDPTTWTSSGRRNARDVWRLPTQPYSGAHFATFPQDLARRCILAGCPEGGTVLDPFLGSGTTALVARRQGRRAVGVELNAAYLPLIARRLEQQSLLAVTDRV